jgi:FAD/FMN-containing dehydrogenase
MPTVASWGRYPSYPQLPHASHWRADIPRDVAQLAQVYGSTLPYGNGRSYGDSCLATTDHVLHTRGLDRFVSVDWQAGVIVAEAGVTLEEVLGLAIPQGWFLPVTPGTKYVTLGGAVANDVHGKNHHVRGTFGCHIRSFGLVRSDRQPAICSPVENVELFSATIGGLGLTGVIEWVELQLIPIQSCAIDATTVRFDSLREFFELSHELDSAHEYSVAWVDCLATGASVGRGVFTVGDHAKSGSLESRPKRKMSVPITPPVSVINRFTLRLFNSTYYSRAKPGRHQTSMDYDAFFYPLDRLLSWNRIYGPKGFQQYQCVIPEKNAQAAIGSLLDVIAATGNGSFLAVLKRCGDVASPGLLSFPMPGVSLALDFPQHDSLNSRLFPRLDALVREAGGRLYPAKDAHMSGNDFRNFYANWQKVEALRDPALCSRFWNRVASQ